MLKRPAYGIRSALPAWNSTAFLKAS